MKRLLLAVTKNSDRRTKRLVVSVVVFSPRCLVQRCVALVIPRVHLRPLDQQRQSDVVVPVPARQMQGGVLDAGLRVEIRPLVDQLSYHIIVVTRCGIDRSVDDGEGIDKKRHAKAQQQRCARKERKEGRKEGRRGGWGGE